MTFVQTIARGSQFRFEELLHLFHDVYRFNDAKLRSSDGRVVRLAVDFIYDLGHVLHEIQGAGFTKIHKFQPFNYQKIRNLVSH